MSAPMSDPLARAHADLRAAVPGKRKDPAAQTLGAVIMHAVGEADEMRAAGAEPAAIARALEAVVRDAWPKGREDAWRDLCGECGDYGWQIHTCPGDASCGLLRTDGQRKMIPHAPHEYAKACWCAKGRAMLPKPKQESDELAQVGKVSKPTRWGR